MERCRGRRSSHLKLPITESILSRFSCIPAGRSIPVPLALRPSHSFFPSFVPGNVRLARANSFVITEPDQGDSMRFFSLAGILLYACVAYAQSTGSIRGVVSFEGGQTVAHDATVHLEPAGRTARTAADGSYEFANVPPGRYEVVAHLHFFSDERRTVTVAAGSVV